MEDYQILIDHAWSLNPDLFEMFRQNFQIHLNKRRSIVEFQGKMKEGRRQLRQKRRIEQFHNSTRHPARDILPRKIARDKLSLHPSKKWMTPIESIHPSQYSIAGLAFEPEPGRRDIRPLDGMMFDMYSIRQVCAEFGWEIPDAANEATKPRPYIRALMELEG
tara:strand:+ start:85 stop:573 length:489 start_codon:yes stop_codon:yes gene_type:complete